MDYIRKYNVGGVRHIISELLNTLDVSQYGHKLLYTKGILISVFNSVLRDELGVITTFLNKDDHTVGVNTIRQTMDYQLLTDFIRNQIQKDIEWMTMSEAFLEIFIVNDDLFLIKHVEKKGTGW